MENPGPVTSLNFEESQINLNIIWDDDSSRTQTLQVTSMKSIMDRLGHEPPTAYELEVAIADIEDTLMPIIPKLPEIRYLVTSEPSISQISKVAVPDTDDQANLTMEAVELLYNRLVELSYGTPSARLGVPETSEFAAKVLFLRELMHNAGFDAIHILPS